MAGARAATPATLRIGGAGVVNAVQVARRLRAPQRGGNSEAQHIACKGKSSTSQVHAIQVALHLMAPQRVGHTEAHHVICTGKSCTS